MSTRSGRTICVGAVVLSGDAGVQVTVDGLLGIQDLPDTGRLSRD